VARTRRAEWWLVGLLLALVMGCAVPRPNDQDNSRAADPTGQQSESAPSAPPVTSTAVPSRDAAGNQDPARFALQVRTHAEATGMNPVLVMAILYNESYKPHDPELERAWQKIDPDAAFGIANMHRAAFDDTKQGRPFADRAWEELPDEPELAIQAAAWYLHDLNTQLPDSWAGPLTRDELLALGYNAGPGNMTAFADGAPPGIQAQSYLDRFHGNWARAEDAIAGA